MTDGKHLIHAVAFQNGPTWVAQCLEHDIATQAPTVDALLYELERILVAHLVVAKTEKLAGPFEGIPKAPRRFWEMYRRAQRTMRTVPKLPDSEAAPEVEVAFSDSQAA